MDCDDGQLQRRTERGECVVTTGGVCLDGEEKGQIDGSKATLDVVYGGTAAETVSAAHGFLATLQNEGFCAVPRVHLGNVSLERAIVGK